MANLSVNITTSLADNSVSNAKLADMNEGLFKGRSDGAGNGDPEDLDADDASTILDGASDPFVRTSLVGTLVGPQGPPGADGANGADGTGTAYYGQCSKQTTGTINIATAGTYQSTGLVGSFDANAYGFGLGTTDTFALKNTSAQPVFVEVYGSADIEAGNNKVLGIKLAKNGVPLDETECQAPTGNATSFAKLVTNWMVTLAPNDEIALFVTNHTTTGNITLLRGKLVAQTVGREGDSFGSSLMTYTGGLQNTNTTSLVDVHASTEMAIDGAGEFEIEYAVTYSTAATAVGIWLSIDGTASFSYLTGVVQYETQSGDRGIGQFIAYNGGRTSTSSLGSDCLGIVQARIIATSSGVVKLRYASEVSGQNVSITNVIGRVRRIK